MDKCGTEGPQKRLVSWPDGSQWTPVDNAGLTRNASLPAS
jgi:hypothetical protein